MKTKSLKTLILFLFFNILNSTAQNAIIIPKPNTISFGQGTFLIDENTSIVFSESSKKNINTLQEYFKSNFNIILKIAEKSDEKMNKIQFISDKSISDEGYQLTISNHTINIVASTEKGWFYGLQTLIQICSYNAYFSKELKTLKLKEVAINDAPRFKWRAFMLDEARYFKGNQK